MRLSKADHDLVTSAVTEAERHTDGEIVTIVARESDGYYDVVLHWAVVAMLLALALLAWQPGVAEWLYTGLINHWAQHVPAGWYLTIALVLMAMVFGVFRLAIRVRAVRMLLTPGTIKSRRVAARALHLFRTSAEQRTKAGTGVLLYLSLAEHRAEIVAEASIHAAVAPEVWGEAMAALLPKVRDGKAGEGMADAVRQIGIVLAEHFPRTAADTNELPDRLIEL